MFGLGSKCWWCSGKQYVGKESILNARVVYEGGRHEGELEWGKELGKSGFILAAATVGLL